MADAVVANASPLILLSRAGCLDFLRVVGEPFVVPRPVLAEIEMKGPNGITVEAMPDALAHRRFPSRSCRRELAVWELGTGESSVLAWVREHAGSVALLDDLDGRRCVPSVDTLQIRVLGTMGGVLLARRVGVIPFARPVLEKLVAVGMYLFRRTLSEAPRRVRE